MRRTLYTRPTLFCLADVAALVAVGLMLRAGPWAVITAAAAWAAAALAFGLCDRRWWSHPRTLPAVAAKTWAASSLACCLAAALAPLSAASLHMLALPLAAFGFGLALRAAWRVMATRRGRSVVVVDAVGERRLKSWLSTYWPEWDVAGVLDGRSIVSADLDAAARGADVLCYLNGQAPYSASGRLSALPLDDLLECVRGRVAPDHADAIAPPTSRAGAALKRTMDVGLAGTGLVLLSPLMALVAALIKLESRGPAIYRQQRLGLGCRAFQMLKFRSMVERAELETGPVWARPNDPRCTVLGRLIRPLHVDELPQLVNVLRGEMSLVGPRPERPELARQLLRKVPAYRKRHAVKPGITGWAQVNQGYDRGTDDVRRKLEYDLFYVKRAGPLFDAAILLRTMDAVIFGKPEPRAQQDSG